jgi:hypothetical protein
VTEPRYTVDNSGLVAELFRTAANQAADEGRLPVFLLAARWIISELERTPMEFGESREYLPTAQIHGRCGFARPLYVEFGVHEPTRLVFLRKFRLVR